MCGCLPRKSGRFFGVVKIFAFSLNLKFGVFDKDSSEVLNTFEKLIIWKNNISIYKLSKLFSNLELVSLFDLEKIVL